MNSKKLPSLSRGEAENLLDAPFDRVLSYDFRTNTLNRSNYAGHPVSVHALSDYALAFKRDVESMIDFGGRKVVMVAVQGVPNASWNGKNQFVKYPLNEEESQWVVGNIVAYNPKTGLYEVNPNGWMGIEVRPIVSEGKYIALNRFLFRLWAHERERQAFVAPFKTK